MAVRIELAADPALPTAAARAVRRVARAALAAVDRDAVRIGIGFATAAELRALNGQYRGKDYAANVLSFPGSGLPLTPRGRLADLGDVWISPAVVRAEAREHDVDARVRMAHLIAHGVLHLCGLDHERSPAEARHMAALEERLLDGLDAGTLRALAAVTELFGGDGV